MGKAIRTKKWSRQLKVLAAALLTVGCLQVPAYAANVNGSLIRVAMFANLGSTYKSTTPLITLESSGSWGLEVGGTNVTLPSGQVRFSADGFRVKVLETADFKTAAAAAKLLQATADKRQNALSAVYRQLWNGSASRTSCNKSSKNSCSSIGGASAYCSR